MTVFTRRDRKLMTQWRDDLRTTTAKQGQGALVRGGRYCCLGRLCEVTGERADSYYGLPDQIQHPRAYALTTLVEDSGIYQDYIEDPFSCLNDTEELTFDEIADLLTIILLDSK